jgi:OOP family OmpA-OmpF porin
MLSVGTITVSAAQGPYIGLNIGYYGFDSGTSDRGPGGQLLPTDKNEDSNTKDGVLYGLHLGYQFNNFFALEASYSDVNSETSEIGTDIDGNFRAKGSDIDVKMYRLDALFSQPITKNLSPYLVMGYAHLNLDPEFTKEQRNMFNIGGGIKYSFTKAIALRGDVRGFFDDHYSDYNVNLGLFYLFDITPPPPVKAPEIDFCALDDDNDGVNNCNDSCQDTVAGSNVDDAGCLVQEVVKSLKPFSIKLQINFASDKSFIRPNYFSEIKRVVNAISEHPNLMIEIAGYTDSRGNEEYNQQLSQRRADAVRSVLIAEFGIDENRITAFGYGETQPIADNSTAEGRAENRRVIANFK